MNDYPRVTEILQAAGLIDYSKVPPDKLEFARTRGQAVHLACQLYDTGTLDTATLDPRIIPYLEAWKKYRAEAGGEIICIERPVFSRRFRYRGTLDRIIRNKRGLLVVEIKTTYTLHKATSLQLAAYQAAWQEENPALHRHAVLLHDSGKPEIEIYTNPGDFNVFLSALNIVNWKRRI